MRTDLREEILAYVRRPGNGCWFSSVYLTLVTALKNKTQYVCKVQSSSIKFALPLSLKCFLGRCGHSPRVYWCMCVCVDVLGERQRQKIVLASFWNPRSTQRGKRFSRRRAVSKGYSEPSTLPTGIWNGKPVSITLSQAFAMTSVRLMGEDRKGWRRDTDRWTSGSGGHGWGDMWKWTDSGCWEQPRHTSSKVNLWEMSLYR